MFTWTALLVAASWPVIDGPAPEDEIRGDWVIVSIERDGKKQEKDLRMAFEDGRYTLASAEGFTRSRAGRYELDADESPKEIALIPSDGPMKGKPIMGICRRKGDRLEACYDPSGAGRPKEFEARPGTGFVLVTYRRREK